MNRRRLLASLAVCAAAPGLARADGFPSQNLRIVVPQPAGGGFDTVGRLLAERLQPRLGRAVVIENRTGAGTTNGTVFAAQAPADGHTLLLGGLSNMALNPGLNSRLPYDPIRDFVPVGLAVTWSYTLVARRDLAQATLADVIAFARANPDRLTYASAGPGSGQHVAAAVMNNLAGVRMTHVPYRGAQAAYQDLIGGRVDLFFDISSTALAQVQGGTVRALAVSSVARQASLPDVPSVTETGVAQLDMESWFGLFAPRATPSAALTRLRRDLTATLAEPELQASFARTGGRIMTLSVAETEALVARDVERFTRLIREAGLQDLAT